MPEINLKVAMACEVRSDPPQIYTETLDSDKQHCFTRLHALLGSGGVYQRRRAAHPALPSPMNPRPTRLPTQGCSSAVQRVLGKMPGIQGVDIDMAAQKVVVRADDGVDPQAVKDAVAKTGKATEFWS